jgi:quinol monooxygenase YgiN
MLIVHVQIQVKPEALKPFIAATQLNATASRREPGVLCFDVLQQADDPARFVLVEIYRDAAAQAAHRDTAHYPIWRDTVASMMAVPRVSTKYTDLFPADA